MAIQRVYTVSPRGFCAGVARAIKTVEDCLRIFGAPIYIKHQIVHNKKVVSDLADKGAITVDKVKDIPSGATAVFSAHGSPPADFEAAKKRNIKVIDATCPLVTKVHLEVQRYVAKGYKIIYIGHNGHPEGIGVRAETNQDIPLVESPADVKKLNIGKPEKIIYLTQTTLSLEETKKTIRALKKKFPQIVDPPKDDICYATTNRQIAIKKLAAKADLILVVGSNNSSNSNRLVETARSQGVSSYLIDDVSDIKNEWLKQKHAVGISAGASAPEILVQQTVQYFVSRGAKHKEMSVIEESLLFNEPVELKKIKENISG